MDNEELSMDLGDEEGTGATVYDGTELHSFLNMLDDFSKN
jgi:hypothetical protein